MTRRIVHLVGAFVLLVGVVCQLMQTTDPEPAASYFTVWSAVLAVVVLAWAATDEERVPVDLWGAAVAGTVLSGLTFALVIAPATETGTWFQPGDDRWVRAANVLLHGVGPAWAAVTFAFLGPVVPAPLARHVGRWLALPAGYLTVVLGLQGTGFGQVPYPFLDPTETPWHLVVLAAVCLAIAFAFVGAGLAGMQALTRRPRAR